MGGVRREWLAAGAAVSRSGGQQERRQELRLRNDYAWKFIVRFALLHT